MAKLDSNSIIKNKLSPTNNQRELKINPHLSSIKPYSSSPNINPPLLSHEIRELKLKTPLTSIRSQKETPLPTDNSSQDQSGKKDNLQTKFFHKLERALNYCIFGGRALYYFIKTYGAIRLTRRNGEEFIIIYPRARHMIEDDPKQHESQNYFGSDSYYCKEYRRLLKENPKEKMLTPELLAKGTDVYKKGPITVPAICFRNERVPTQISNGRIVSPARTELWIRLVDHHRIRAALELGVPILVKEFGTETSFN